jgi:hypothetical protein
MFFKDFVGILFLFLKSGHDAVTPWRVFIIGLLAAEIRAFLARWSQFLMGIPQKIAVPVMFSDVFKFPYWWLLRFFNGLVVI